MTNKELAVQLYTALIQAQATIIANPNCSVKTIKLPSNEEMVKNVEQLTSLLSKISEE